MKSTKVFEVQKINADLILPDSEQSFKGFVKSDFEKSIFSERYRSFSDYYTFLYFHFECLQDVLFAIFILDLFSSVQFAHDEFFFSSLLISVHSNLNLCALSLSFFDWNSDNKVFERIPSSCIVFHEISQENYVKCILCVYVFNNGAEKAVAWYQGANKATRNK